MQARVVAIAAVLVCATAVSVGVAVRAGSDAQRTTPSVTPAQPPGSSATPPSIPLSDRPDSSGPAGSASCLGGVCVDELPEAIPYETVAGYLTAIRAGLDAARTPEAASTCHDITHEVGRRAARASEPDLLLDLDDGACLYGYQHGVLEGWSLQSDFETVENGIATVCAAYEKGYTTGGVTAAEVDYARGSCDHGLGHAIALQYPATIKDALALCDPTGPGRQSGCAGGVFMAYGNGNASQGGLSDDPALAVTADEVKRLCPELQGAYRSECWAKLWLLADAADLDFDTLVDLCPRTGDEARQCGHGIGVSRFYNLGAEWSPAAAACSSAVREFCLLGVAWANANTHVGGGNPAMSYVSICASLDGVDIDECTKQETAALAGAAPS